MKILHLFFGVMLVACGSRDYSWDSGAGKQSSFESERQEEQEETTREQFPDAKFLHHSSQPL